MGGTATISSTEWFKEDGDVRGFLLAACVGQIASKLSLFGGSIRTSILACLSQVFIEILLRGVPIYKVRLLHFAKTIQEGEIKEEEQGRLRSLSTTEEGLDILNAARRHAAIESHLVTAVEQAAIFASAFLAILLKEDWHSAAVDAIWQTVVILLAATLLEIVTDFLVLQVEHSQEIEPDALDLWDRHSGWHAVFVMSGTLSLAAMMVLTTPTCSHLTTWHCFVSAPIGRTLDHHGN